MQSIIDKTHAPFIVFIFAAMLLTGCASRQFTAISKNEPITVLTSPAAAGIIDGRARFREIFCGLRNDHGRTLPDDRPCEGDTALWRMGDEPPAPGRPVPIGPSTAGLRVVLVPGFLADCEIKTINGVAAPGPYLETLGYKAGFIQTGGKYSTPRNADIIHQALLAIPGNERIVVIAHSKGVPDTLQALVDFPELTDRVVAVISVSGAVNGSPLVDLLPMALLRLLKDVARTACPAGIESGGLVSLRRSVRMAWLASHPLPKKVRYYSIVAFAGREDISSLLKPFHSMLFDNDPMNDGMLLCSDAIIPGSTLLGYPNADHVAVSVPFDRNSKEYGGLFFSKNAYPREILIEAALKYVEEDLAADASLGTPQ